MKEAHRLGYHLANWQTERTDLEVTWSAGSRTSYDYILGQVGRVQ